MSAIHEINVKALHAATGDTVRAARAGQMFRVTLNGELHCLILPPDTQVDPSWDEIMADVRAAREKARLSGRKPTVNPVLAERRRRTQAILKSHVPDLR